MRSVDASLSRRGLIFLWAVLLSAAIGAPGLAKSAPDAATASSDDASPAEQAATAATEASPPAAEASSPSPAEAAPAGTEASKDSGVGSEVEWTMDEATGKRYTVTKIPKRKGTYIWRDENHIRLPGGLFNVEVVKHDENWFWIKLWEPRKLKPRSPSSSQPTPEELERAAATYAPPSGSGDRIRLMPFDEGLPRSGQWRQGFDVGDMNGDGHLDVVFGPSRKGRPRPNIFLGDSRGHWRLWTEARYPDQSYDYGDAAVADFNGDGHQDVAFGFHLRGMLALVGDGAGGFEAWTEGLELQAPGQGGNASAFSSRAVEAIDWNRDGRPDLLALGEGPKGVEMIPGRAQGPMINTARSFALFVNNGDGSWSRGGVEDQSGDFGDDFALGDFDQDGARDLAIASRRRGNRHILRVSSTGKDGLLAAHPVEPLRPQASLTAVAAADVDGDGFEEFFVAYVNRELGVWRTGIDVYFGNATDGWQRQVVTARESRAGVWDMTLGELDGDGKADLVAVTGEGETWVFLGGAENTFVLETSPELPARAKGCRGSEVRLVDLDDDGRDEVLASFAGEPTGPTGLPGVHTNPGCQGQGRIYAWRAAPADAKAVAAPATGP